MNNQSPRGPYILKSRCPRCSEISTIEYTTGIEKHQCSKGHQWEKTPEATAAALLARFEGERK